ncbi:hypothetical protein P7K49_023270 [Saguinus oedipus]|uniref:Ubiquitin-like domain-containing protein n=1 Tax=Saguinus oedipus TaxID=9490 RepID=A0ABQ9UL84_SAGOE|nr:hypothetical protein P7K49_023270 [Saguinus oedipus]
MAGPGWGQQPDHTGGPGLHPHAGPLPPGLFLRILCHKTTIFTDTKESSTVFKLKRIIEGILKGPPDEQQMYKDDQLLDDSKTLGECGFTIKQHGHRPQPEWGLSSRQMTSLRPCASSRSPVHPGCLIR